MAVRNIEGINRQGAMIAQQQRNAKNMREENFWNRVNIIKKSHNDAIDFIDTVEAIYKNGLREKFNEWMKQQNVCYTHYNHEFRVCCLSEPKQTAYVYYVPLDDNVQFGWSGYGMCECYSTNRNTDYFIHSRLDAKGYDEGLTMMATRLQPFIDAFFAWVEKI